MPKVTDLVLSLATPIAEANGCSVWDVEYIKEAGTWFLRVYIDKPDCVGIDDCEAVSRALSDALDEIDPIEASYTLEISSAGLDRVLRKPEQFAAFLGSEVEVRLYRPVAGRKDHVGTLISFESGDVTIETQEVRETYPKKDVAQVRLYVRV
ncbi:MAG: ribosome maturation factor RimP [Pseudoflavonifractor sp.]